MAVQERKKKRKKNREEEKNVISNGGKIYGTFFHLQGGLEIKKESTFHSIEDINFYLYREPLYKTHQK